MKFFTSLVLTTLMASTTASTIAAKPAPLPSLTKWAENVLAAVITSPTVGGLAPGFDAFLSQDVAITVNNMPISRAEYVLKRTGKGFANDSTIVYADSIEVPAVANSSEAGVVSLFFTATIGKNVAVSSMNVVIKQDPSVPNGPGCDARRAYIINQVILESVAP
ncbi:hypothetical protein C8R46DRAFT_545789 [Mycena filopes]|nr:hypothetical protein C8R46DRAFT_545789 [Mycena filopes]